MQHLEVSKGKQIKTIDEDVVAAFLGPRKYQRVGVGTDNRVGITNGLVWSELGGELISIETVLMEGSGRLMLTGSLGDVLRESAQAALSLIRSRAKDYDIAQELFKAHDLHIHFPAGAIPKDGPSAGITIFIALLSLLTGRPCRADVALTGEMTLSGRVLPVSGIREKLLAAQRAGIKKVLLPEANQEVVDSFEQDITADIKVVFVSEANDAIEEVLLPK